MTPTQLVRLLHSDAHARMQLKRTLTTLDRFKPIDKHRALKLFRCNVRDAVRLAGHGVTNDVQDRAANLLLTAYLSDAMA